MVNSKEKLIYDLYKEGYSVKQIASLVDDNYLKINAIIKKNILKQNHKLSFNVMKVFNKSFN